MADSSSPKKEPSNEVTPKDLPSKNDQNEINKIVDAEFKKELNDLQIENARNILEHRRTYFRLSAITGISWLVFTGCVVYANGVEDDWQKFSTSDGIVMTLIGSSSVPSLALVGKYLFNRSKD